MTKDDLMTLNKRLRDYENVEDVIVINKNATNGDVIKALFPHIEIFEPNKYEIAIKHDLGWLAFKKEWWNKPYKRGDNE
jgi:hypothetical protein